MQCRAESQSACLCVSICGFQGSRMASAKAALVVLLSHRQVSPRLNGWAIYV
jgi:hypothetical protein